LRIFDTLSATEKELDTSGEVRIYACGVTVYDESHIGHARTIIVFDSLRRFLESQGIKVKFIQNFTDVDDKIINRAKAENVPAEEISSKYITSYFEGFDRLNVKRADFYPKATEHISDMIDLIRDLIIKNIAYVSENGVYFSVSKFKDYGKLSKKKIDELIAGARVEVDETKRDPLDFALWKFADSEPRWQSPWGQGRPGWHIECSAMSLKYLGPNFEIHGGGRDLIFPHHENEIAQSESYCEKNFAKIWMHVGMVTINGEKMSKSLGNTKSVEFVLNKWGPNIIRFFCLSGHYSKPIDYAEDLLKETITKWRQVENCYFELVMAREGIAKSENIKSIEETVRETKQGFTDALNSDFNTPLAISEFFMLIKAVNHVAASDDLTTSIAGIALPVVEDMLKVIGVKVPHVTQEEKKKINDLIQKRNLLREQKKFQEADQIRKEISDMGIVLIDHKTRTLWLKQEKIGAER
jgi:cysteinyl-tRNA synthetase